MVTLSSSSSQTVYPLTTIGADEEIRRSSLEINCFIQVVVQIIVGAIALGLGGLLMLFAISVTVISPEFNIESVSVSLYDSDPSHVTAEWNISFLVENDNAFSSVKYEYFNVSIKCLDANPSRTVLPGFYQSSASDSFNAIIRGTPWPRFNFTNFVLEFDVNFLAAVKYTYPVIVDADKFLNGTCRGISVGLTDSGGTRGSIILREPITCYRDSSY